MFVYPALSVGMPLSVMEAMACGKPVIVTSVGYVPLLVKNGVNGIVIPPSNRDQLADSIIYLAENPELSNRIGEVNVRKMNEYDWAKIAKQYHALYLRTLESRH